MEELIDMDALQDDFEMTPVAKEEVVEEKPKRSKKKAVESEELVNCLRNELVRVDYIKVADYKAPNKEHPWYGGLSDGARISLVLPTLRDGVTYVDPLTKDEKNFLEDYMGLEPNALSIYKRENNFWDNRQVILSKEGIVLDLSVPNDYISYKILLANKDIVAPSPKAYKEKPLATYRFVLTTNTQRISEFKEKVSIKANAWKAYSNVEGNADMLRVIVETLTGKAVDANTDIDFLKEAVVDIIDTNPAQFTSTANDPLLPAKILIYKGVDNGVINKRGDFYYYNNVPLCEKNSDPTITVAAAYISKPKNQEIKFSIEAKLK